MGASIFLETYPLIHELSDAVVVALVFVVISLMLVSVAPPSTEPLRDCFLIGHRDSSVSCIVPAFHRGWCFCILSASASYPLLHPIRFCILSASASYPLLHPIRFCILSASSSYPLLHPIRFCILSTSASYPLLHPIHFFILSASASYPLLHPIRFCILSTSSSYPL
ncbi:unnamed protein product, partial [Discosporangium mesarthrocarpum]